MVKIYHSIQTEVNVLPSCGFCKNEAKYDGKTVYGPWGYMCQLCFDTYGTGLGIGKGQELILKEGKG